MGVVQDKALSTPTTPTLNPSPQGGREDPGAALPRLTGHLAQPETSILL